MSDRYPGGLIRKTPPTVTGPTGGEGGSAPGIWTMDQVAYYIKEGTWPKPVLPRELYTWGSGGNGNLGLGDNISRSSPTQVGLEGNWSTDSQIDMTAASTLALKTDGTLWVWGNNGYGLTGNSNTITVSSPVQVGSLTSWYRAAIGTGYVLAIKTDGSLWAWGNTANGRLGTNDAISYSSPVQVGLDTDWAFVSAGSATSAAIKTDGSLWTWGSSADGRSGQNIAGVNVSSPVQIGSLTNWAQVCAGNQHMAAVKTDGTFWVWGKGNDGRLGRNNQISVSSPVQVGALTNWSQASTGDYQTLGTAAVKTDGTLWAWGSNSSGQLGIDNQTYKSSPTQIGALSTWSQVSIAQKKGAAIKTDGTLWVWGGNINGELGQNDVTYRSSPTQVGAETNWNYIEVGGLSMIATIKATA